ncbi:hypothetical protein [uncultured Kordia sp.]|uniref:hypothetical protein n=1 Tax=uncultured Kordia sp. TaxID=507699 RepID=UPI0026211AAB|nr:hypothetical protein [uncultured Kordia sp.]
MDDTKKSLLKIFSGILKRRSSTENNTLEVTSLLIKYFKRKELIEIITSIYNGSIPKEYNLVEMENEELLNVIADDMFVISYVTYNWSKEILEKRKEVKTVKTEPQKPKANGKQTPQTSKSNKSD